MKYEKVNYICTRPDFLDEQELKMQSSPYGLQDIQYKLGKALSDNQGWLRVGNKNTTYYYNSKIRGLLPDLSNTGYTEPLLRVQDIPDINSIFPPVKLAGMNISLLTKKELLSILEPTPKLEELAAKWNWNKNLFHQYFCVIPCEMYSEVCRVDGGKSVYWGTPTTEHACTLIVSHLSNYTGNGTWSDDILFLLRKNLIPDFGPDEDTAYTELLETLSQHMQSQNTDAFSWEDLERAVNKADPSNMDHSEPTPVMPNRKQAEKIIEALCLCDYERVSLHRYDKSILEPLNGHWDLWQYVRYNPAENSLPEPPFGKVWANVSALNIYARNAAEDLALSAETVAVDFGTKSTTVARVDEKNHIITVPIGEYASTGTIEDNGYENPTILKYVDFDSFITAYHSAVGRPETKFNDLSASRTAEKSFKSRSLSDKNDIFSYQYQIKQWAYNSDFEPFIYDKNHRIEVKSYKDIQDGDFDPIEIYAYLVGLNVVNMRYDSICTRYLLSYPPSYSRKTCERIRKSFEKGIQKAIPKEAQESPEFRDNFSVLLWQSEPAAYAVCAIKEFGIAQKNKDNPVFCGVYDLGGGTVDYHFGIFSGNTSPYVYEGIRNGGNPRMGCENILEELAYDVFSKEKDLLASQNIKYEFPSQYAKNLADPRYTSNSRQAKLNTLGMVDELRDLWIHHFQTTADGNEDLLCQFEAYPEEGNRSYYIKVMQNFGDSPNGSKPAPGQQASSGQLVISIDRKDLENFFYDRLKKTIREFLGMMVQTLEENGLSDKQMKNIIFLAGNGSKSPMVSEIFSKCMEEDDYWKSNCELYAPLLTEKAKEMGQKTENRMGSIPTAKTGVAHGLLISRPGSDFVRISERHHAFAFKYYLGTSQYDPDSEESIFKGIRRPDSFKRCSPQEEQIAEEDLVPFPISADGYVQFWYTDSLLIYDATTLGDCNARQFLRKVPEDKLGKTAQENKRGDCFCRAISETELELLVKPIAADILYFYGKLNLDNGKFEAYP